MNIIKVTNGQIEELQTISIRTFEETFGKDNTKEDMEEYFNTKMSIEVFKEDLAKDNIHYYMLIDSDKVVGYIKLDIKDNICKLVRIYILNECQGKGYGQKLIDYAIEAAKDNNAKIVELGVWEHNLKALKFYQKNKFEIVDSMEFVLGTDVQNDYVMQLKIGE